MTLLISNADVAASVTLADCVDAIERCYRSAAGGRAAAEPRTVLWSPRGPRRRHALALLQGAGLDEEVAAVRIRSDVYTTVTSPTGSRDEKSAGRPGMFCGLILLFSTRGGELLAIINDGVLQQMRVAATAALAARLLAPRRPEVLAVLGSGNQARWHVRALAAECLPSVVRIYSPDAMRRAALAAEASAELGTRVVAVASAREAVEGAGVVATCTNAREPVLDAGWIAADAFVTSVRHRAEMDPAVVDRASAVVAHESEVRSERALGSVDEQSESAVPATTAEDRPRGSVTLLEVLGGAVAIPDRGIRYFLNNQGSGLQFVAVGARALAAARDRGLGHELPDDWFLQNTSS